MHHQTSTKKRMKRTAFAGLSVFCLFALACSQPPPGRGAGEVETTSAAQGQTQGQVNFKVVRPSKLAGNGLAAGNEFDVSDGTWSFGL